MKTLARARFWGRPLAARGRTLNVKPHYVLKVKRLLGRDLLWDAGGQVEKCSRGSHHQPLGPHSSYDFQYQVCVGWQLSHLPMSLLLQEQNPQLYNLVPHERVFCGNPLQSNALFLVLPHLLVCLLHHEDFGLDPNHACERCRGGRIRREPFGELNVVLVFAANGDCLLHCVVAIQLLPL